MSKNDRNIDFFEIWQKTSKKPQKNIKNLEKIATKNFGKQYTIRFP